MGYDGEQEAHGADPPGETDPAGQGWQPLAAHANGSLPGGQLVLAPVQPVPPVGPAGPVLPEVSKVTIFRSELLKHVGVQAIS